MRARAKEQNGFRLTQKRKDAIALAKQSGFDIDFEIFKNPATHAMSVQEIVDFAKDGLPHVETPTTISVKVPESFSDIEKYVSDRFELLNEIVMSTSIGINKSLIISGAAGMGKSTEVIKSVESVIDNNYKLVKGKVTPASLYRLLYDNREDGKVIIFDDSDNVFADELSLNILKSATDSHDDRLISWHSSREMVDEDGEIIDNDFVYNGSIIFISNIDIYKESLSGSKMSEHYKALISRSFVIDLSMKNEEYYMARVKDVLFNSMEMDLNIKNDIYDFMSTNKYKLRELSLRMVNKIKIVIDTYGNDWRGKAQILLCK